MADEVAFCNTPIGMHAKAKELNIPAYNLGCSCESCNREFELRLRTPLEEFNEARRESHKQRLITARTNLALALEGGDPIRVVDSIQSLFEMMAKEPK